MTEDGHGPSHHVVQIVFGGLVASFRERAANRATAVEETAAIQSLTSEDEVLTLRVPSWLLVASFTHAVFVLSAGAQTSEFLPEVDVYDKLNSTVRLQFQVKHTREDGDPSQVELGPSVDLTLKPWLKLRRASSYDLDESKSRALALSFGYRYVSSANSPLVNRFIFQATPNFPLKGKLLLSDRNRGELNLSDGTLSWRYRNRVTAQRTVVLHSYHPIPYASAEFFYNNKYQKWSSTSLYAGGLFPLGKHIQLDLYYEHQNSTGKKPNQQVNALGVMLNFHF
jgi:hypothetical protein